MNIAIDGPSGAGKSSIAKLLAKKLKYVHLDTGSMYRCVAYKACLLKIALDDEQRLCKMIDDTKISFDSDGNIYLDDQEVKNNIRTNQISLAASKVSTLPAVRAKLVALQQKMAQEGSIIMDGRDIGTVVLKDAPVKIFLTASSLERAKRRYKQNLENGIESDLAQLQKEIDERDYQDTHRAASPLQKASDAIEIDSSTMSIDEVVEAIFEIIQKKEHEHD
ncbi:MAG: (d)CMP kinase [Erysipelotrichaceae bacterium]|nr:(d)CMP kinase [Erysipelotrichaceae bacterium]MDY5252310.1 (d)CMP kinase [Erysipelotrichaceae bacterium]